MEERLLSEGGSPEEPDIVNKGEVDIEPVNFKLAHPEWYYELPSDRTLTTYITYPYHSLCAYTRRLRGNFGSRFVIMLFSAYFGIKGCAYGFIASGQLPYFRTYMKVDGVQYQNFQAICLTPWAIKALMGAISDSCPIFGYYKRYYILFAALFGTAAFILLAALPLKEESAIVAAMLFMLANCEIALVDLLCEGKYAELMVKHPHTSSDVVTYVWWLVCIGSLVTSCIVGPLADAGHLREMFWIAVPFAGQIIIPTILGYLPETPLPPSKRGIQWEKLKAHQSVFILAVLMALGAVGLAVVNIMDSRLVVLVYSLLSSVVLVLGGYMVLPRALANCNFYMFTAQSTYISISGAVDYYYTATNDCVPNGPNFDYTYYTTWSSIAQALFGILGVTLFQATMSTWEFRHVFWVTALLKIFAGVVDIVIVERWNKVAVMLDFMPAVVLTSKLCPKNMESTVYALLAGFQNFGQTVSKSLGVYMMDLFSIKTTVPCNFNNLTYMILLCHMILPLLHIPLTFILIPKAKLTDTVICEETKSKKIQDHEISGKNDDGHEHMEMQSLIEPEESVWSIESVALNNTVQSLEGEGSVPVV